MRTKARARTILSSLHEELSIFIDNDTCVFATLSRDVVHKIATDAKETALKFEIPSNFQDTCDAIFSFKAGVDPLLSTRVKITMHVLARLCTESEKNVSMKFGGIVSETFVDVETLVLKRNWQNWIYLDHVENNPYLEVTNYPKQKDGSVETPRPVKYWR